MSSGGVLLITTLVGTKTNFELLAENDDDDDDNDMIIASRDNQCPVCLTSLKSCSEKSVVDRRKKCGPFCFW
jgi:hypothetical protein